MINENKEKGNKKTEFRRQESEYRTQNSESENLLNNLRLSALICGSTSEIVKTLSHRVKKKCRLLVVRGCIRAIVRPLG